APATAREPEAVRAAPVGFFFVGRRRSTGCPSRRNPGPRGKARTLPCRSSRLTTTPAVVFSAPTTAPTYPLIASSRTMPSPISTGRDFFGRCEDGESPERTSEPERSKAFTGIHHHGPRRPTPGDPPRVRRKAGKRRSRNEITREEA